MIREMLEDIITEFNLGKFVHFFREKNRNAFAPVTED